MDFNSDYDNRQFVSRWRRRIYRIPEIFVKNNLLKTLSLIEKNIIYNEYLRFKESKTTQNRLYCPSKFF
jgi:hypothetical protein